MRLLLLGLCATAVTACLPGPEQLLQDADVVIVVTGCEPGDRLTLATDDDGYRIVAGKDDVVEFFLELGPGEHTLALEVRRGPERLCEDLLLEVGTQTPLTTSVRADELPTCGGRNRD